MKRQALCKLESCSACRFAEASANIFCRVAQVEAGAEFACLEMAESERHGGSGLRGAEKRPGSDVITLDPVFCRYCVPTLW